MTERPKLLYIIVKDGAGCNVVEGSSSFRYTRPVLQSTLQLIGCKPRHAFKISQRVFEILREESHIKALERNRSDTHEFSWHLSDSEIDSNREYSPEEIKKTAEENECRLKEISKKLYDVQTKRSTVVLTREDFMAVVCNAMSGYRYVGPNQRSDFALASRIREKETSVTILLCGTSGCGKSTLSTLLASRLGITSVVSTDSIRHMMRSFASENENPLLYASTYSAGERLDPMAVAEAKAKKLAKNLGRILGNSGAEDSQCARASLNMKGNGIIHHASERSPSSQTDVEGKAPEWSEGSRTGNLTEITVSSKTMAVQGYKAQSEMVIDSLDRLITSWEQKCESVIVEGVHLSLNFVIELMKKHPTIIPFMIYIAKEEKHLERFAVRAKYMTLDPAKNKYVKYIRNIRAIQDYLCKRADKHLIPRVNNTNMDQSVASIHATIFACLRRREGGEPFYDETTNTVRMVDDEYKNQCAANSLGSKGMLQVIRRRGSSRQLMALMNNDGSVAKAWPIQRTDTARRLITPNTGGEDNMGYDCEALEVSPVNLYFGNFGLSAWSNDMGGTSQSGSIDGLSSRGDGADYQSSHRSSRYGSSCSSSPRMGEGAEKELLNQSPISGSDEEQEEDVLDLDSEGERNDDDDQEQQIQADVEGSVGDQSIASDDEDDYMVTAVQEENGKGLDSVEYASRTILRAFLADNDWCKPHESCEQDSSVTNNGGLSSKGLGTQHDPLQGHGKVMAEGENRKLSHGRSKSLPVLAGPPWND